MTQEEFNMQLRETYDDALFETLVLEADDCLRTVREMTPEQRAKVLPDIKEALVFLITARWICE